VLGFIGSLELIELLGFVGFIEFVELLGYLLLLLIFRH
jgi:hypothetical protein